MGIKPKVVSILLSLILMLSLVFLGTPLGAKKATADQNIQLANLKAGEDYVDGEFIVKFESDVSEATISHLNSKHGTSVKPQEGPPGFKSEFEVLEVPKDKTVPQMVKNFSKEPGVKYAEPNYISELSWTPNDPGYPDQWHFDADHINMPAAWDLDTTTPKYGGDPNVIVAVIDSGVAYENYGSFVQAPDLANTTFVDGYDFINNDSHPNDGYGHGTHVTGTIAQSTNDGIGVAGIAFNSSIMPIKVFAADGSGGTDVRIANAIIYAKDNGAHVINMSLESQYASQTMHNAIIEAKNAGLIIVVAAGNGKRPVPYGDGFNGTGDPTLAYPAAYSECIAVGATDWADARAPYSNYGTGIDIVAPGGDTSANLNGDIYVDGVLQQTFLHTCDATKPVDYSKFTFCFLQGTSMAAPHVTGVVALLLAQGCSASNVQTVLQNTARDLGSSGYDTTYGYGLVRPDLAIAAGGDFTPPSSVSSFTATSDDKQIKLSWTNPTDSDFAGVKILRKTGSYPTSHTDGTVVHNGTGTSKTDTGLTNGTKYYYSIFAYDEVPNYSSRTTTWATPKDSTPPSSVSSFKATSGDRQIKLSWKNPTDSDFAGVKILRKTGSYPTSHTDGTKVYSGKGTSKTDTGLTNGIKYYYSAFTYDEVPNYSSREPVSAIPKLPKGKLAIIAGAGPGGGPHLRGFDRVGGFVSLSFFAYDEAFKGGVNVASGDVTGDGIAEIIVGAGKGGGPHVRIFDKQGKLLGQFFAYHPDFRGGVKVALGDINGNGKKEIICGAGEGGGPHIRVFNKNEDLLLQFFAYDENFRGGVNVAAGDINGDGIDEIIAGAGVGGGPHVRVFDQKGKYVGWDMFPFHPNFRGGVKVAAGDTDGDGKDEIGVCQASNGEAWCKVYKYNTAHTILGEWLAYPRGVECGADIAMFDIDSDTKAEVITGAGVGGGPQVRGFEANGTWMRDIQFFAYDEGFRGGVNIAVGAF